MTIPFGDNHETSATWYQQKNSVSGRGMIGENAPILVLGYLYMQYKYHYMLIGCWSIAQTQWHQLRLLVTSIRNDERSLSLLDTSNETFQYPKVRSMEQTMAPEMLSVQFSLLGR